MRYRRADAAGGTYFFTVNLERGMATPDWGGQIGDDVDGYGER